MTIICIYDGQGWLQLQLQVEVGLVDALKLVARMRTISLKSILRTETLLKQTLGASSAVRSSVRSCSHHWCSCWAKQQSVTMELGDIGGMKSILKNDSRIFEIYVGLVFNVLALQWLSVPLPSSQLCLGGRTRFLHIPAKQCSQKQGWKTRVKDRKKCATVASWWASIQTFQKKCRSSFVSALCDSANYRKLADISTYSTNSVINL